MKYIDFKPFICGCYTWKHENCGIGTPKKTTEESPVSRMLARLDECIAILDKAQESLTKAQKALVDYENGRKEKA